MWKRLGDGVTDHRTQEDYQLITMVGMAWKNYTKEMAQALGPERYFSMLFLLCIKDLVILAIQHGLTKEDLQVWVSKAFDYATQSQPLDMKKLGNELSLTKFFRMVT